MSSKEQLFSYLSSSRSSSLGLDCLTMKMKALQYFETLGKLFISQLSITSQKINLPQHSSVDRKSLKCSAHVSCYI